ncbi:hypothetical protein LUZ61_016964 [Rhynchospora tenuis]|uniref:Leucine-rich repeat-containing N-terminal plant-type domain-containing protein n=1 Tax=Rhynchospora tenuis TaxID=198213 RepID=A0AAD5Z6J2_9POAL|nr:hypothetical protein LUZ61_016964 [Rhynchospora tenuis]
MSGIFFLLLLSSCTSLVLSAKHGDGAVLLKIKEQLGNPEALSSWAKGLDFCNGSGNIYPYTYIGCTSTGRVSYLGFASFPTSDVPFPNEICRLTELEVLFIDHVFGFNGPLPSCINKLVHLDTILIHRTSLSGHLPDFHNLNNLTYLEISQSGISGPIPPSLSSLPNLQTLDLHWNDLNGTIPPALVHLPTAALYLNDNSLSGELPRCYGEVNIRAIDVSTNRLTGDASFLFGKDKTFTYINLSKNQFTFDLSYIEIPENLTFLDISFNGIYGKVPDSLATARDSKLVSVDLKFNPLCGTEFAPPTCTNSAPAPAH